VSSNSALKHHKLLWRTSLIIQRKYIFRTPIHNKSTNLFKRIFLTSGALHEKTDFRGSTWAAAMNPPPLPSPPDRPSQSLLSLTLTTCKCLSPPKYPFLVMVLYFGKPRDCITSLRLFQVCHAWSRELRNVLPFEVQVARCAWHHTNNYDKSKRDITIEWGII